MLEEGRRWRKKRDENEYVHLDLPFYLSTLLLTHTEGRGKEREGEEGRGGERWGERGEDGGRRGMRMSTRTP